jgi:hypothetical protein
MDQPPVSSRSTLRRASLQRYAIFMLRSPSSQGGRPISLLHSSLICDEVGESRWIGERWMVERWVVSCGEVERRER